MMTSFFALILQCSDSFYMIRSPLINPANSRHPFSGSSLLAKKVPISEGTLKPIDKEQSYKVFRDFIINPDYPDCSRINKVNAAESFKRPRPSIFKKKYLSKNEFRVGEELFQNRLRPMLEKNTVFG